MDVSVLETGIVVEGRGAAGAIADAGVVARRAEELGFARVWVAEHHNSPSSATSSPAVLIAHLAARTERIRVGSGAVLLPNHPPLVVAEQFNTLAALYPGRIDLGIGRAAGTDPVTALALRRQAVGSGSAGYAEQLRELLRYLRPGADDKIRAVPETAAAPEVWLLAGSPASGRLAGELGLSLAVAHHLNPDHTLATTAAYRDAFRTTGTAPRVMVSAFVVLADTDERARELTGPATLAQVRGAITGRPVRYPPTAEAAAHSYDEFERELVARYAVSGDIIGGPDTARTQLARLLDDTGADELIAFTPIAELPDRLRSLEILREAMTAI